MKSALGLCLLFASAFPSISQSKVEFAHVLETAALADPIYQAEREAQEARRAGAEAAASRRAISLSFSGTAGAEAAPLASSGQYGLPISARVGLSLAAPQSARLLEASLEATRTAVSARTRRALEDALARILGLCLGAAESEVKLARAEERAARAAMATSRSRGDREDSARVALQAAQTALELEEAHASRDAAKEAARIALGADPPDVAILRAFLEALPRSVAENGKAQVSLAEAMTEEAGAALSAAEWAGVSPSFGLSTSFNPLDAGSLAVSLSATLSYAPPDPAMRLRSAAALAAAAATGRSARAELAAQELSLSRIGDELASLQRRLPFAEQAWQAARVLAELVELRLSLSAATGPELDAAFDLVAVKVAAKDALEFEILRLTLERARIAGIIASVAGALP